MKIKICGIKNEDTIKVLNDEQVDYAGFIFAKSPRQISFEKGEELIRLLDSRITPVGVFVNGEKTDIERALRSGIKVIQLHGQETPEEIEALYTYLKEKGCDFKLWKALSVKDEKSLAQLKDYETSPYIEKILFDTGSGGTGKTFNWSLLNNYPIEKNFILAGGLNKDNILAGIECIHPEVVDINSGVEVDGEKSEKKIREIVSLIGIHSKRV